MSNELTPTQRVEQLAKRLNNIFPFTVGTDISFGVAALKDCAFQLATELEAAQKSCDVNLFYIKQLEDLDKHNCELITVLRQQLAAKERECGEYRGLLYGCDKHKLWNGFSCIGCVEEENLALRKDKERHQAWIANRLGIEKALPNAGDDPLDDGWIGADNNYYKTLDEAIDAAMKKGDSEK